MRKIFIQVIAGLLLVSLSFCILPFPASAAPLFPPRRRVNPAGYSAPPLSPKTTASLEEFAHAYELKTTLEGAIYKTTLPMFVYEGLVESQRSDLAVFNADGQLVPFTLRAATPTSHLFEKESEYRSSFYELPPEAQAVSTVGNLDVYIKTDSSGQVVSVRNDGKSENEKRDRNYLWDLSSIIGNNKINAGEIARREMRLYLPNVRISARLSILESSNLRDWNSLLTDMPLLQLVNEKERLASDRVELPRAPKRYVMLQIRGVDQSFELKDIGYIVTVQERSSFIREENTEIGGTIIYDNDNRNTNVEYDTFGAFPISKLNFTLREPGFYKIAYFSRRDTRSIWQPRGGMELSMIINQDGSVIQNEPVSINVREDRYWRVSFEGQFHGAPPIMKITWQPSELYFLAQGKSPYVLAFGSHQQRLSLQNDAFLQDRYASAMEAKLGGLVSADSAPDNKPAPYSGETPEWQRYIVWGLLVLGGLLLSAIAWKLMKPQGQ